MKKHRLAELNGQKKNQKNPTICFLQKTHLSDKYTQRPKVKGQKKIYHINGNQSEQKELYSSIT